MLLGLTWADSAGFVLWPRVWRDDTSRAAVAPLALAANVVSVWGDGCGAPRLVLCQVGLVPRARPVDDTVELEGEDAGEVGGRSADGRADSARGLFV